MLDTLKMIQTMFGWRTRKLFELLLVSGLLEASQVQEILKENVLEFWPRQNFQRGS